MYLELGDNIFNVLKVIRYKFQPSNRVILIYLEGQQSIQYDCSDDQTFKYYTQYIRKMLRSLEIYIEPDSLKN